MGLLSITLLLTSAFLHSTVTSVTYSTSSSSQEGLKIAAFNLHIFGVTKVQKMDVMEVFVKIIRRYDIILLQEIRDSSETSVPKLLEQVNNAGDEQYEFVISERLGRTNSKEQYAFFYRKHITAANIYHIFDRTGTGIFVKDTYQYSDPGDIFEREPYAVHFQVSFADVEEFALVAIHTSPDSAVTEIDALTNVREDVKNYWGNPNILILGDFNADCSYVSKSAMKKLLLKGAVYHWLIDDDVDTTVAATDCAYDRFVMTGSTFVKSVIPHSANIFRFDLEYGLTLDEAKAVSDHYPIEVTLKATLATSPAPPTSTGVLQSLVTFCHKLVIKLDGWFAL